MSNSFRPQQAHVEDMQDIELGVYHDPALTYANAHPHSGDNLISPAPTYATVASSGRSPPALPPRPQEQAGNLRASRLAGGRTDYLRRCCWPYDRYSIRGCCLKIVLIGLACALAVTIIWIVILKSELKSAHVESPVEGGAGEAQ